MPEAGASPNYKSHDSTTLSHCGDNTNRQLHAGDDFCYLSIYNNLDNKLSRMNCERTNPAEKRYKCSDCGKSFKKRSALLTHDRTHTGEKPCSVCSKRFSQSSNLPYRCPDCGNTFSNKSSLTRHRRNHTGQKPYKCSHCGKRFKQSSGLLKHERTHARQDL
uniref:C2H2-type domain-containing protein n=1 Tax=Anolis carolinensis TaxID=28377 RepID=A0A803SR24_ANOCA